MVIPPSTAIYVEFKFILIQPIRNWKSEPTHCPGQVTIRKSTATATNYIHTSYKVCFLRGEVADETCNMLRLTVNLDGSARDALSETLA